jgi:hypothetical protein
MNIRIHTIKIPRSSTLNRIELVGVSSDSFIIYFTVEITGKGSFGEVYKGYVCLTSILSDFTIGITVTTNGRKRLWLSRLSI